MTDITYKKESIWTHFFPETTAGEVVFREMMDENGVAAVLTTHAQTVISQIRKAGYSVCAAKPATKSEIEKIFSELETWEF